jgi:hypothetical protein
MVIQAQISTEEHQVYELVTDRTFRNPDKDQERVRSKKESLQVRTQACRSKGYHLTRVTEGERWRVTTG